MHLLQSVQWPGVPGFGVSELLYMRAEPRAGWEPGSAGGIKGGPMPQGVQQQLAFSTFFGAFSLSTWCCSAGLESVVLAIECSGRATLEVYEDNGHESPQLVLSRRIAGDGRTQYVDVLNLKGHRGMLYPVFTLSGGDSFELASLAYCTRVAPRFEPRVAIVMPTFKRERACEQNIARISAGFLTQHPESKLFVIDNGGTLKITPPKGVEVFRNLNYGGSGGFARGMLEVKKAGEAYTHVLFCDDDVLVCPESLLRLLALLRYRSDAVVSGGMLQMGERHILDQKACYLVGIQLTRSHGFDDMRKQHCVARYDEPGYSSFCGWWFACYPLSGGDRFLPMPYFLFFDDIEMGRRCARLGVELITLLGVATWHEEFEKKFRAWRGFYHARNSLVTTMLYDKSALGAKQIFGEIHRVLETYRYDHGEFMLDGMDAVMAGPEALKRLHPDKLHQELLSRPQVAFTDMRKLAIPERMGAKRELPLRKRRWRTFFSKFTLNGHLLPLWFFKTAREPSFPGWKVEDLNSFARWRIFRARKVAYLEQTSGYGSLCEIDHWRFFKLLTRLLVRWTILRWRWRSLRDEWRAAHDELKSADFWRHYLKLTHEAPSIAGSTVELEVAPSK